MTTLTDRAQIDKDVAERSVLIKNMMEDLGDASLSTPVPIPNVRTPLTLSVLGNRFTTMTIYC
jgi:S-phase kinase-associated protein 1